tara:strand:+ start:1296 stop:1745 length:450 start_codon:yes stop_codon:yes gene_type:complete
MGLAGLWCLVRNRNLGYNAQRSGQSLKPELIAQSNYYMTYIVNDKCINCKYTDCVEVCPVDCFYEGENTLVIHPDECIDCGVCEPECPAEAILPDSEPGLEFWLEINREMADIWPNISQRRDPLPTAEASKEEAGKFDKYFSRNPGEGN